MIDRELHARHITGLLKRFPVVAILGARQVGKTTLANLIVPAISERTPREAAPLQEEKINQFADAYLAVEEVHSKTAAELKIAKDPAAANEVRANAEAQVIQAIERTGLRLQEFNQIVELCAVDPALRMVVASKVEERRRI